METWRQNGRKKNEIALILRQVSAAGLMVKRLLFSVLP